MSKDELFRIVYCKDRLPKENETVIAWHNSIFNNTGYWQIVDEWRYEYAENHDITQWLEKVELPSTPVMEFDVDNFIADEMSKVTGYRRVEFRDEWNRPHDLKEFVKSILTKIAGQNSHSSPIDKDTLKSIEGGIALILNGLSHENGYSISCKAREHAKIEIMKYFKSHIPVQQESGNYILNDTK